MRVGFLALACLVIVSCGGEANDLDPEPQERTPISTADNPPSPVAPVAESPAAAAGTIPASCRPEEEKLFSCVVRGGSQLSVCANPEHGPQYRFGKGEGADLVLSEGTWASVAYSGGGEAQIKFENGDTSYVVFSRIVRTNFEPGEPNNPAISDGVVVLRGEEVLAVNRCIDPDGDPIDYNLAERLLPRVDELFTFETSRADPEWPNKE
ncbi:MAG: hypothetical protein QNJ15_08570 [Erythrobacter sp.]|nr:hypothetical protein [Erythrobacter sp.]